ncbi:hypothetical protein RO3G_14902 [Rhizopus delemar RA 99-880]|uniref:Uncharacterized protein n=1 Tax=Rhizopus delemar (strain RA 99-880 / ATCC MYA-4621 / FGSC 9543 / NRRL 43880) TaxID=246409 RepID=I1CP11_RHIO9|nr:hypothetical protein RO3G_14902 [Rhizopus delemar RA 99-880]|eukprot:EIE90191.1 hypothetical protein RO3G_14902 [Rhizopus delemar RA 99-880]
MSRVSLTCPILPLPLLILDRLHRNSTSIISVVAGIHIGHYAVDECNASGRWIW